MIVELAGPPGAGKTTMLSTALSFLQEQGIAAFTVVEAARPMVRRTAAGRIIYRTTPAVLRHALLWRLFLLLSFIYRMRFIVRRPRLVWHVLRWQWQRPPQARSKERRVTFWLFRLMGYYEFLQSRLHSEEVLILDEGFLHRVVQLFASDIETPNPSRIRRYAKFIPAPDLAVFILASPATCQERIYGRGLWAAFEGKTVEQVASFVHNAHHATMVALKFSRAQGWPIIEIENDGNDPAQAQDRLQRELGHFLARQAPGIEMGLA